ncbi:MAG TPA: hypothetical protein VK430_11700 [Xanthobacteraceae bacterium]|nr:hypothetical protein [Xanthobacteraceae bacterium]
MTVSGMHRPLAAAFGYVHMSWALGSPVRYWWSLKTAIFDAYHPEQHYMRGPGPKWREKHAVASS